MRDPLLSIEDLVVEFRDPHRPGGVLRAVDGVSLTIAPGEILGLVGESGSGKTTLGKTILRLYEPREGRLRLKGLDITHLDEAGLRPHRRAMQMVFQDPLSSFNPRHTVGEALAVPLRLHRLCAPSDLAARVARSLEEVGLRPDFADRYPHQMSGGQLQRAAIGRALTLSPELIVADEAVSKLDVSVRAQILNLLRAVQARTGLAMVFITHDLHVARFLCHRIAVMHFGKLLEIGPTEDVFQHPQHDYTRALLGTLHAREARARTPS
ncbi:peptide/nickel transport system ATP-binding protein/oligopeptide transport system ATP-binding protein [Humitalea rosea]|uniref:Peptide/nickel transport system ATP-binding protein/oligopeptide transport system ATP-binding protein n=1 Tax=Humitalea rosea TaxID=990373 RepID=A0A2W7IN93_9PROT|nr:ATP-binding cassette domain-containing protein [Humitalea rosea]PZW46814.1 peptide/nickel transport system ATP-binding protein/oligopeptide transport system ATP-binding protein [Humitalea rosea]